ncbi:unnamed protein product, partial [Pylaiella littoralis]
MRGASPEVGQEKSQPDDNLRQPTGIPRVSTRHPGRAGSPKGEGGKRRQRVVCPCSHDPQQFAVRGGEIDRVYGHGKPVQAWTLLRTSDADV